MKRSLAQITTSKLFGASKTAPPFFLIAGPCVLESVDSALRTAEHLRVLSERLQLPIVFKASFDKANRQSTHAYRGPGLEYGLDILHQIKHTFGQGDHGLLITTDIHESHQAEEVAKIVDILQIPALLCRQTDLITAAAKTGRLVNIKKGPFASPKTMLLAAEKVRAIQSKMSIEMDIEMEMEKEKKQTRERDTAMHTNHQLNHVMLTERGTFFGYDDLVFDPRNLVRMRSNDTLVIQDVTHSVQSSSGGMDGLSSGGDRELIPTIARAAAAVGVDGLFFETHESPEHALCDGPNQWPLHDLEELIQELMDISNVTKTSKRNRNRNVEEEEVERKVGGDEG